MALGTIEPELLTIEESAQILRIGRSRAYEMAEAGHMPGLIHMGRSLRVSKRRLLAWIEEQTSGGATSPKVTPLGVDRVVDHSPTQTG